MARRQDTGRLPLTQEELRVAKKAREERFETFLQLYKREKGITGLATFFPHVEPVFPFEPVDQTYEFRDREVARCEALWKWRLEQNQRGKKVSPRPGSEPPKPIAASYRVLQRCTKNALSIPWCNSTSDICVCVVCVAEDEEKEQVWRQGQQRW